MQAMSIIEVTKLIISMDDHGDPGQNVIDWMKNLPDRKMYFNMYLFLVTFIWLLVKSLVGEAFLDEISHSGCDMM